jgi:hypothetical protein
MTEGRPLVIDMKQLAASTPAPVQTPYQAMHATARSAAAQRLQDARRQSL